MPRFSNKYILTGEKLVNFLVEPKKGTKWPSNLPRFKTRQEAIAVCKELCRLHFIHRSEKRGKGDLVVSFGNRLVALCWYLRHMLCCVVNNAGGMDTDWCIIGTFASHPLSLPRPPL